MGLKATVTSITEGKIGHTCNQIKHEDLTKTENVVLPAGQNCLNEIGGIGKDVWQKKTLAELKVYEAVAKYLADKGKKIFLIGVPPTPITQNSKESKKGGNFINNKLAEISQNAMNGTQKN